MSPNNYLSLCLYGILTYYIFGIVARESIVGGHVALSSISIRYQATILIAEEPPRCGGGIISEQYILTAAHCVIAANNQLIDKNISILVGTYDLSVAGLVAPVKKITVPKEYNSQNPYSPGDLAVIKLQKDLELQKHHLKLLRLGRNTINCFYENKRVARIAGFGWDKMYENNEQIGEYSDHQIRFIDADIRSVRQCKHEYPELNHTDKQFCAKVKQYHGIQRGVCVGDGGGPLVYGGVIVIGVLSMPTVGCDEKKSSGIYTNIAHYAEFIYCTKENMNHPCGRQFDV